MLPDGRDQPGDVVLRRLDVDLQPELAHGFGGDRADGSGEHLRRNRELEGHEILDRGTACESDQIRPLRPESGDAARDVLSFGR